MRQTKDYDIDSCCALGYFVKIFDDRWKLYIVYKLLEGEKRFKELKEFFKPYMTQKTLCVKLKELEDSQIIQREAFNEIPPRVIYSLSAKGTGLKNILENIYEWGSFHIKLKN